MSEKITPGMRKVILAIHNGRPHRASQETYQRLIDAKLASYVYGFGWVLQPAGMRYARHADSK